MVYNTHKKGFTLIELLVVIAIIALISSIVIVNIAESSKKGRNSGRNTQVREYIKAIEVYRTNVGEYPYPGNYGAHCLGEQNDCAITIGSTYGSYNANATLRNALTPYVSGYPPVDTRNISFGNNTHKGAVYICDGSDGICTNVHIYWTQEGSEPVSTICGPANQTPLLSPGESIVCHYQLN